MNLALEQAKLAEKIGEVPVGAVIVKNSKLISTGYNHSIARHDPSGHAEIVALRSACQLLENYRLIDCDLYVTLEPCMMCLGALIHARIKRLYFAASDPKTGSLGGLVDLAKIYQTNHRIEIIPQILSKPCSELLKFFFKSRR
ncbi:MAG: tRNA adenosine(34) deaminase TadA [Gammaproteobacteria bacterium]|nr:tRNA adenosine(34) deaminase TadA [Gammaproteobacteria bacterium]